MYRLNKKIEKILDLSEEEKKILDPFETKETDEEEESHFEVKAPVNPPAHNMPRGELYFPFLFLK